MASRVGCPSSGPVIGLSQSGAPVGRARGEADPRPCARRPVPDWDAQAPWWTGSSLRTGRHPGPVPAVAENCSSIRQAWTGPGLGLAGALGGMALADGSPPVPVAPLPGSSSALRHATCTSLGVVDAQGWFFPAGTHASTGCVHRQAGPRRGRRECVPVWDNQAHCPGWL